MDWSINHQDPANRKSALYQLWIKPMSQEEAARAIRAGWITGMVSATITVFFIVISRFTHVTQPLNVYSLIDVALVLALSAGIARRNRTAAVLMVIYFLANRVLYWMQVDVSAIIASLPLSVFFLYFFIRAIRGTFAHYRFNR